MTRAEILALEGRELDFAVDRHVFGGWRLYVPRYSSDIAAAWQVVEAAGKRVPEGYSLVIKQTRDGWLVGWADEFGYVDAETGVIDVQAVIAAVHPDFRVAACRAALLAVCGEGEA